MSESTSVQADKKEVIPATDATLPRPAWITAIRRHYKSGALNQFILYGNIYDQFPLTSGKSGSLLEVLKEITDNFDIVIIYRHDRGLSVEKGETFVKPNPTTGRTPDEAIPELGILVRAEAYKAAMKPGTAAKRVAVIITGAEKVAPAASARQMNYELSGLVAILRTWATDDLYREYPLASFLITPTLADLHPDLVENNRALAVRVDIPDEVMIRDRLEVWSKVYAAKPGKPDDTPWTGPLGGMDLGQLARALKGVMLESIEQRIKLAYFERETFTPAQLTEIKKTLVEKEAGDLLEFLPPKLSFRNLEGCEEIKTLVRKHLKMWREGNIKKFPKGYMINGPVGTGKSFFVKCLAGEANVPVIVLKNFRDMWYGKTEANLERIFRILRALSPCFVFVDEADQTLGKRDASANDGGLSGRIYSAFAQEMADPDTQGKIVWVLATSRPDLVTVDLKRPGRMDVKFALMPTATAEESAKLIQALMRNADLNPGDLSDLLPLMPDWLTPGAADAITKDVYTDLADLDTSSPEPAVIKEALKKRLETYHAPISREQMQFQITLSVNEASCLDLIPEAFRKFKGAE